MSTNIDINHGLQTSITKWLKLHKKNLPHPDFPTDIVISLLGHVMKDNAFPLDDCWFHLTNGTAMGTSVACTYYATIYYSYHKETCLLKKSGTNLILFYHHFINDIQYLANTPYRCPSPLDLIHL
jgi:hypothetical protein